jgi:hypothetical protein
MDLCLHLDLQDIFICLLTQLSQINEEQTFRDMLSMDDDQRFCKSIDISRLKNVEDGSHQLWTCGSVAYPSHPHVPVHIQIDLASVKRPGKK